MDVLQSGNPAIRQSGNPAIRQSASSHSLPYDALLRAACETVAAMRASSPGCRLERFVPSNNDGMPCCGLAENAVDQSTA
jgi:hypothetical protein